VSCLNNGFHSRFYLFMFPTLAYATTAPLHQHRRLQNSKMTRLFHPSSNLSTCYPQYHPTICRLSQLSVSKQFCSSILSPLARACYLSFICVRRVYRRDCAHAPVATAEKSTALIYSRTDYDVLVLYVVRYQFLQFANHIVLRRAC